MEKKISSNKNTEKDVLWIVKGFIEIIVKFNTDKLFWTFGPNILLRSTKFRGRKVLCSNTLKKNNLKVYISLFPFQYLRLISGARFGSWFLIKYHEVHVSSWCKHGTKSLNKVHQKTCVPEFIILPALKFPSCGLVVFIDITTNRLTEGRNFKHSWKILAVTSDSCYMFTKKMLSMMLNCT